MGDEFSSDAPDVVSEMGSVADASGKSATAAKPSKKKWWKRGSKEKKASKKRRASEAFVRSAIVDMKPSPRDSVEISCEAFLGKYIPIKTAYETWLKEQVPGTHDDEEFLIELPRESETYGEQLTGILNEIMDKGDEIEAIKDLMKPLNIYKSERTDASHTRIDRWRKSVDGKWVTPLDDAWIQGEDFCLKTLFNHLTKKQQKESIAKLIAEYQKDGDEFWAHLFYHNQLQSFDDDNDYAFSSGISGDVLYSHSKPLKHYHRHQAAMDEFNDGAIYGPSSAISSAFSSESEVILALLAMAIMIVIGTIICCIWWLGCAVAGYYFMSKDQVKKKKEKEDYQHDIESQYVSN